MSRGWIIRGAATGLLAAVLIADPAAMFGQSRNRASRDTARRGDTAEAPRTPAAPAAATEDAAGLPEDSSDRLDLLVRRNIFLQSRRPRPTRTAAEERPVERRPEPTPVVRELPNPGRDFALRGVAVHGEKRTAFLEDMRSRSAIPVSVGDLVAGARIVTIELDFIEVEAKQERSRIAVGQDLTGSTARVVYVPGLERRTGTATITSQQQRRRGEEEAGRGGRNRGNRGGGFGRPEAGAVNGRGGDNGGFDGPAIIVAPPDFDFDDPVQQPRFEARQATPADLSREEALRQRRLRELQRGEDD